MCRKLKKNPEFIAEIGNNHNGSIERAERLIKSAKKAGATVAKFQMRDFTSLYRQTKYGVEDLGVEYTKDLIEKYELSLDQHLLLVKICNQAGIEYMCTPWDHNSVEILEGLGVKRYKVASADFDNIPLVDLLIETKKPLIFSTGMSTDAFIKQRIEWLNKNCLDFTILHCNSTYPAPFEDIQLNYIKELQKYTENVGYSGHERGISVSLAAVALGAVLIERHLTEDKALEGPDHEASLVKEEFLQLTQMAGQITSSLGGTLKDGKNLSQGVLLNREVLGKSIIATVDIPRGTLITKRHLDIKSPGQGLSPSLIDKVIGREVTQDIAANEFITMDQFILDKPIFNLDFNLLRWGIPVRPHDFFELHPIFNAPVYEFHVSYKDLIRPLPEENWTMLSSSEIVVHSPELFENSKLLDLTDQTNIELHLDNLNRVCEFSRQLSAKIKYKKKIKIVTNIGGFSTHSFKSNDEKLELYKTVAQNLTKLDETGCEITIQNMAPFPWHFGGQRYQNIFADPFEAANFCGKYNRRMTLDTSHLSMYCKFSDLDFETALETLMPWTAHLHVADASGTNGEGVKLGSGDINFRTVLNKISPTQTFIVETWQGHKSNGAGFIRDLSYLSDLIGTEK